MHPERSPVLSEIPAPTVEHQRGANPADDPAGVPSEAQERVCGLLEEQAMEQARVALDEGVECVRQGASRSQPTAASAKRWQWLGFACNVP